MSESDRIELDLGEVVLSVRRWGRAGGPQMVLVPGTGLASELFLGVERLLGGDWDGYTIDRRGQGRSSVPENGYDFADFGHDLQEVVERLGLEHVTGVGHSAGGTDMLIAAAAAPQPWRRLVIFEPTLQDPRTPPLRETRPPSWQQAIERTLRRRDIYPSLDAACERFQRAPNFERVEPALLQEYLAAAFEPVEDGTVRLRCSNQVEAQMLRPIMQVMQRRYTPPAGAPDPFRGLLSLEVPVTMVTTELSGPIYHEMAARGVSMLPNVAATVEIPGTGHLAPLEAPRKVAEVATAAARR